MIDFGFASFPNDFIKIYESSENEFTKNRVFFLEHDYLSDFQKKTNAFPKIFDRIKSAASDLISDEAAAHYVLFVQKAMKERELFLSNLSLFVFPDQHHFAALLCFIPSIIEIHNKLTALGLPKDVVHDSIAQFEDCVFLNEERTGVFGFGKRYFDHMQRYVDLRILNIGRLRFELYENRDVFLLKSKKTQKEMLFLASGDMNDDGLFSDTPPITPCSKGFTAFFEEDIEAFAGTPINPDGRCKKEPVRLQKSEFEIKIKPGDTCLGVHIPAKGALTKEACDESYKRAIEIYKKHFPQHNIKAFRCHSWMMAPELEKILSPDSNLVSFQKPYLKYPAHTKGEDVFVFVFKSSPDNPEDLPDGTSLQRALKKLYLSGSYLYEYNGIFTI